jgi:sugar lactone lactonase YvrE
MGATTSVRPGTDSPVTPLYAGVGAHYSTPLANPMGIFFDNVKKECYVADTGNGQVVVFNTSGMPIYRFPHLVPGRGDEPRPGEPRSVAVDAHGDIYVVDGMVPYIDVLDVRGRSLARIDVPDDSCGQPERFVQLALGADQSVYAITACRIPRVVAIGDDHAVARIITLRPAQDERACINGFTLDQTGNIYITNSCATLMVQIYAPDGAFLRAFGKHDTGFENFAVPAGLAVTGNGDLWVVDTIRQVVSRFDHEGKLLAMIGGKGSQPGAFEYPSAVATDGGSLLFVLERQGGRYQCFQIHPEEGAASEN